MGRVWGRYAKVQRRGMMWVLKKMGKITKDEDLRGRKTKSLHLYAYSKNQIAIIVVVIAQIRANVLFYR